MSSLLLFTLQSYCIFQGWNSHLFCSAPIKKCDFYENLWLKKLDLFLHDTKSMSTISDYSTIYLRGKCIDKNYCDKQGKQFDENGKEVTTLQYLLLLKSV